MKLAVFNECISKYGGKTETELFQSFAYVQQEYVKNTFSRFENDLLSYIKTISLKTKNISSID